MMKKIFSILLACVLVSSMVACSNSSSVDSVDETTTNENAADESNDAEDGYSIGFIPTTLTNEYFSAVLNGVETACDELGCELITFDPQSDSSTQASQIEDMIASGIDALVYVPIDSVGSRSVLQTLKDNDVVVVNVDNVIGEDDYDLVDAIIASDNIELGYLSGQWVAENKPDGANILICHNQVSESCILNVEGFWKGIEENASNPDDYVELQVLEGSGDTQITYDVVTDALQAYEDVDVIYCINDTSALGAIQAVEEAGLEDEISILGKDGAPIGKKAISEGQMAQTSAQRPTYIGYLGVTTAVDILNGEEVTFNTAIPSYSITADNIDEYDIDAWDTLD